MNNLCSSKGFVREMTKRGFIISVNKLHRLLKEIGVIYEDGSGYKSNRPHIKSVWSRKYVTHYLLFTYEFIQKAIDRLPKETNKHYTYTGVCSPIDCDWDTKVVRSKVESFKGLWSKYAYGKYLLSDRWSKIRAEAIKHHGAYCHFCGNDSNIAVHHKTYRNVAFERYSEVMVLCSSCHKLLHSMVDNTKLDPRKYPDVEEVDSYITTIISEYDYCDVCKEYTFHIETNYHEITCHRCLSIRGYDGLHTDEPYNTVDSTSDNSNQYEKWEYFYVL